MDDSECCQPDSNLESDSESGWHWQAESASDYLKYYWYLKNAGPKNLKFNFKFRVTCDA